MRGATAEYLKSEDNIESWLEECCERRSQVTLKAAFSSYRQRAERSGVAPLGRGAFSDALETHGFTRQMDSHLKVTIFYGFTLKLSGNHWSENDD